jgi:hypothetical protein
MNLAKLLVTTVVVGIVLVVWDGLVHGMLLQRMYYAHLPNLFRADTPMGWAIVGEFVFALVWVWVYDRVYASFGGGVRGGAAFGVYAGVLLNFPMWIFNHLMFVGFPYSLSWWWVGTGIVISVIAGAVTGALYKK